MNALQALFETQAAGVASPQLTLVLEAYAGYDNGADFNSPELLRPYEAFLRRYGQDVAWSAAGENQQGWRPASPARLNELRDWFGNPKARFHDAGTVRFRGGTRDIAQAPMLSFTAYPRDALPSICCRAALPLTDGHLADVRTLVREFFEGQFPLAAATVGFGLAYDGLSFDQCQIEQYFRYWAFRHPGLVSSGDGSQWKLIRAGGLHDVNWITVLGQPLSDRVGGLAALQRAFEPSGISCEAFGAGGILIQAGEAPELGDTTQGDTVDLYRQVGRVLATLREGIPAENQVVPGMAREPELRAKWANRFFQ